MGKTFYTWSIVCWMLGFALWADAQQIPQYTLNYFNPHHTNPAYAGIGGSLEAVGVFRKQWIGLEGSPMTQNLNVHLPVNYLSSGVGIDIENDFIGAERNLKISLSYAYRLKLGGTGSLSLGVAGGVFQKVLDGQKLLAPEGLYEGGTFSHNDAFLPVGKESAFTYHLDAGLWIRVQNLNVGFSTQHLTGSRLDFAFNTGDAQIAFRRNYVGVASYEIPFSDQWSLIPSVFAKTDFTQTQVDFSALVDFDDRFKFGAGLRGFSETTLDVVNFLAGVRLTDNWMVVYGYDFSISGLRDVNQGSHEILLKYDLGKPIGEGRLPKVIFNPRLL